MTGFENAAVSRRGEGTPPYGGTYKVCVGAAALPRPTMDTAFLQKCHSEERSDVGIRFPCVVKVRRRGDYGLPHRRARRFAMTGFENAAVSRRGVGDAAPYEAQQEVRRRRADRGVRPYK